VTVLAVDLAAKYSAACLMDDAYRVRREFDSWQQSQDSFVYHLIAWWNHPQPPDVMVVEDLPHGLKYSTLVKTVCRLQGRIVQAMHATTDGGTGDVLFAAPSAWRSHYPQATRGTGPGIVVPIAKHFGYTAPPLMHRAKGNGGRSRADKVATDYCSAYLIARWAIDMKHTYGTYDVPGTSRYDTAVILKKDFHAQDH
jgi:hypothetical protein